MGSKNQTYSQMGCAFSQWWGIDDMVHMPSCSEAAANENQEVPNLRLNINSDNILPSTADIVIQILNLPPMDIMDYMGIPQR